MTTDKHPTPFRRAARATVLALGLLLVAAPAHAAPPETWTSADNGSVLWNLAVFLGIPVAVFLLVALLVYLPTMMNRQSGEGAFEERAEWFGGPRKGVEAAAESPEGASARGGAGGQW